jgi:hypothetical protein
MALPFPMVSPGVCPAPTTMATLLCKRFPISSSVTYFDRKFNIVEGSIGKMVMYVNPVPSVDELKEKIHLKRGI